MTSLTLPHLTIWSRFQGFWKNLVSSQDWTTSPEDSQEDSRASRDFVLEMLDRNPDAFQSELDVQYMAHLYRCKF